MAEPLQKPVSYEEDFYAWTRDQAARLRGRAHNGIDWENAAEEIESLGNCEESELESRLSVLLVHLLKWRFQTDGRSGSWKGSIVEQRFRIGRRLKRSPSLKRYPQTILLDEYAYGRQQAAIEQILDPDFFPEAA